MPAIFKVSSTDDQGFQFVMLSSRGELLLNSIPFASKDEVESAIKAVRVGSLMSQKIGVGNNTEGKFFMISDDRGVPVVRSPAFSNEMQFNNALHSVRDTACVAAVHFV